MQAVNDANAQVDIMAEHQQVQEQQLQEQCQKFQEVKNTRTQLQSSPLLQLHARFENLDLALEQTKRQLHTQQQQNEGVCVCVVFVLLSPWVCGLDLEVV